MKKLILSAMLAVAFIALCAGLAQAKVFESVIGGQTNWLVTNNNGELVSDIFTEKNGDVVELTWENSAKTAVSAKITRGNRVIKPKLKMKARKSVRKPVNGQDLIPAGVKVVQPGTSARKALVDSGDSSKGFKAGSTSIAKELNKKTDGTKVSLNVPGSTKVSPAQKHAQKKSEKTVSVAPAPKKTGTTRNIRKIRSSTHCPAQDHAHPKKTFPAEVKTPARNIEAPEARTVPRKTTRNEEGLRMPANSDVRRYTYVRRTTDSDGKPIIKKVTITHQSWTNLPDYKEVKKAFVWLPGQEAPPEWMQQVGGKLNGIDPETGQIREMEIPLAMSINYNDRGSAIGVVGKYSKAPDDQRLLEKNQETRRGS